ncbi:MAG: beta-L-arabinofuranosidase domain-containing protein [Rariglobus sp.]|nr:beta-L-arabinofuranosidase domain-containing protein [Rariglobus sp.]
MPAPVVTRVTPVAHPFSPSSIRLGPGILKERQDTHALHLAAIEPDRLLAPFRAQAGLPPLAERYGGWESRDISGHSLGHYLSALCHLHAATGDEWILPRIDHIVAELAACQTANADGYVLPVNKPAFAALREGRIEATPFSLNGVWVPFYTLHKLLAGLRDAHRLAGSAPALAVARGVADWLAGVLAPLTPAQVQEMLRAEHGGMNEVFADLAQDMDDPRYLAMASRFFHHDTVLAPMFLGQDRLDGLHGNTQIPKVVGLAREYELTGNPDCHRAAISFWDHVVNHRSYANGGHGESEHFFPPEQFPLRLTPNTCETCNTYNMLKLTGRLFAWHPDAAHMDFVERATINHLAANIGQNPGEFGYFLGLGSVGVKVFSTPFDSWWCCVGTGLENPARYGELIYHHAARTLWVNQYFASILDWSEHGVRLTQTSRFPESDTIRLTFSCARPTTFALKLRHPAWCAQPGLTLNGAPVAIDSSPSSYFTLTREWRDGDTLELRLPMTLRLEPLPHSDEEIAAVLCGPVLLAAIVPDEPGVPNPASRRFGEHLAARGKTDAFPPVLVAPDTAAVLTGLHATRRAPLEFSSHGIMRPADLTFVPLYRIYEEQYAVYFSRLTASGWTQREGGLRASAAAQRALDAATLDWITPGYQQPEVEHAFRTDRSEIEDFGGRKGRLARDGGWFSYDVRVDPLAPVSLVVTCWGGVWHERNFDVFINDTPLTPQRLLTNKPGDFFERVIPIPAELTHGRATVTVRFQSRPADIAGAVYGVRILKAAAASAYDTEPRVVFKTH